MLSVTSHRRPCAWSSRRRSVPQGQSRLPPSGFARRAESPFSLGLLRIRHCYSGIRGAPQRGWGAVLAKIWAARKIGRRLAGFFLSNRETGFSKPKRAPAAAAKQFALRGSTVGQSSTATALRMRSWSVRTSTVSVTRVCPRARVRPPSSHRRRPRHASHAPMTWRGFIAL